MISHQHSVAPLLLDRLTTSSDNLIFSMLLEHRHIFYPVLRSNRNKRIRGLGPAYLTSWTKSTQSLVISANRDVC